MPVLLGTSLDSPLPAGSAVAPLETELDGFSLTTTPRGCLVSIRNNTASDREALIVAAGVLFWFYDSMPAGPGAPASGDYMAGPVHIEVPPGMTVPFRFSDPRRPVFKVAVGVRVLFGNSAGFPPSQYENYFWEQTLPPIPPIVPAPPHERVGEILVDFRMKRTIPIAYVPAGGPGVLPVPRAPHLPWPPIPGPLPRGPGVANWFELAERPL